MLTSTGHPRLRPASTMRICHDNRGQAVVEFTLCFILLVIIAWIPADFGMMFYTSHVGQNAAREGARIASADPTLPTADPPPCTFPCSGGPDILQRISNRVAAGLMAGGASIQLRNFGSATTCDREVEVQVTQTYYPFFYRILRFMGFTVPNSVSLDRTVRMRYEHQC
jgi:hypothetical protein